MEPTKMEPMMEMWLEKANVLIEALPYIQRFHGKTIVVKYDRTDGISSVVLLC